MPVLNPASELLLRNLSSVVDYAPKQLLMVNPPADQLPFELHVETSIPISIQSNDYYIYQYINGYISDDELTVEFTSKAGISQVKAKTLAIIYMPREKPYLNYLLANTISSLAPGDRLWLVGENRSGIKSAGKRLQALFASVDKLDSARHCSLFALDIGQNTSSALPLQTSTGKQFELEYNQRSWQLTTLPGVFSYGSLDPATRMLLDTLQTQPIKGKILDFACGCGVIGLCLSSLRPQNKVDLLDVNAMALASTEINIRDNAIPSENLRVVASNAFSDISDRYDILISNPPFHRHSRQSLEVSEQLILQAPRYLRKRGELRIVANRHLPYVKLFQQSFDQVDILKTDKFFHVISGRKPKIAP